MKTDLNFFPPFGKYAGYTQCEAFNWTLGTRPISPKSRLLLNLSQTVNKPLTWHLQIKQGNLSLADTMWFILWTLNQYENQCISVYGFLISCHGNRCPYLLTDPLGIDEKFSWVEALWSWVVQHPTWACLYIFFRSQVGNSITNSIWTQQERVDYCQRCDWYCLWPVTANEKQTKFQQ